MRHELLIRLGGFPGLSAACSMLEWLFLHRPRVQPVCSRWIANGAIQMLDAGALRLLARQESALRLVLVTPDMQRVDHSTLRQEHRRAFGLLLSICDRLSGTCLARPAAGHQAMTVGLDWQDDRPARLGWSLTLPFRRT